MNHATLIIIVIVVVCCCTAAGYYGQRTWGPQGGFGVLGFVVLLLVLFWLFTGGHRL